MKMNTSSLLKKLCVLMAALTLFTAPAFATDEVAIIKATKAYLQKENPGVAGKVKVEKVDGDYARASVTAEGLDTATVFLKRSGSGWSVLTLGTGFGPGDYKEMGIPKSLQQ